MSPTVKQFLQRWAINTLAVLVAANVIQGIRYETVAGLLVASLLLGILNAFLRPVMMLLSLPLLILTLGLFTFVINALLLYLVGWLVKGFQVETFWAAFWGALIISLISLVANSLLGIGDARVEVSRGRKRSRDRRDDGGGPIIDV
ncbi:MAG: phage holin family protein [Verrucomicrobia bacterium]|nr:phage holin family protein [Verrucomicrobiota bacterium]